MRVPERDRREQARVLAKAGPHFRHHQSPYAISKSERLTMHHRSQHQQAVYSLLFSTHERAPDTVMKVTSIYAAILRDTVSTVLSPRKLEIPLCDHVVVMQEHVQTPS